MENQFIKYKRINNKDLVIEKEEINCSNIRKR